MFNCAIGWNPPLFHWHLMFHFVVALAGCSSSTLDWWNCILTLSHLWVFLVIVVLVTQNMALLWISTQIHHSLFIHHSLIPTNQFLITHSLSQFWKNILRGCSDKVRGKCWSQIWKQKHNWGILLTQHAQKCHKCVRFSPVSTFFYNWGDLHCRCSSNMWVCMFVISPPFGGWNTLNPIQLGVIFL